MVASHFVRWLCLSVLAATASSCGPAAFASSSFEGDREGWLLANNSDGTEPTLMASGGNPSGHLCGRDQADGDIWYFVAPRKFLGSVSHLVRRRLTFDLKQGSIFNQVRGRDVVINGGGLAVTWNLKFAPGLDWTPYSVRLDADSGWKLDQPDGLGPLATENDLRSVLGDVTSIRIRGEFVDGLGDTSCIDNVYWGRED